MKNTNKISKQDKIVSKDTINKMIAELQDMKRQIDKDIYPDRYYLIADEKKVSKETSKTSK